MFFPSMCGSMGTRVRIPIYAILHPKAQINSNLTVSGALYLSIYLFPCYFNFLFFFFKKALQLITKGL